MCALELHTWRFDNYLRGSQSKHNKKGTITQCLNCIFKSIGKYRPKCMSPVISVQVLLNISLTRTQNTIKFCILVTIREEGITNFTKIGYMLYFLKQIWISEWLWAISFPHYHIPHWFNWISFLICWKHRNTSYRDTTVGTSG